MSEYTYSIQDAKEEIKNDIRIYLAKREDGKYILPASKKNPFYIVGEPGIGKTEMARQIAEELGIGFFATSLTHHTRNSVLGLPTITELKEEKVTEYTMPDILTQVARCAYAGQTEGILLIDEFASMSEALVAPMLAFLQNKCIGNHALPEGWVMLLCSNPPEYNETAREFDAAVMDRVRYMRVTYSIKDFLAYAEAVSLHPCIIEYVKKHPECAYLCQSTDGKEEIVTARSWENLSHCIYGYEAMQLDISERLVYQFIKSERVACEFTQYYVLSHTTLRDEDVAQILKGTDIRKYVAAVRKLDYEKKWRVAKLLQDKLNEDTEELETWGRYLRFLDRKIETWEKMDQEIDARDPLIKEIIWKNEVCKSDFRDVLAYLAGWEAVPGSSLMMALENEQNEKSKPWSLKWQELEKQMAGDVLEAWIANRKEEDYYKDNLCLFQEMKAWRQRYQTKNDRKLKAKSEAIGNAICFISSLGDPILSENFIRTINQQSNLLYVLASEKNPVYVQALTSLLGERIA